MFAGCAITGGKQRKIGSSHTVIPVEVGSQVVFGISLAGAVGCAEQREIGGIDVVISIGIAKLEVGKIDLVFAALQADCPEGLDRKSVV